jgi:hypothetical protein
MKYLGKGVLRYAKKEYGYGADLPEGIDKKVLDKMIRNGLVGDVPEKIKPGKMLDDALSENARLLKLVDTLEEDKKILSGKVDAMEKNSDDREALEKEVSKLKKKLEKAGA